MEDHYNISDIEFENQFTNCQLDPSLFSHEAHLRLAWIHIKKYGVDQAIENIQSQLKKFVAHVGATDKYHTTLTIVAVRAVDHFMQKSNHTDFQTFIAAFPKLKTDFKALINSHYSFDIFENEKARKKFLEPDLNPMGLK
ncbi:hypothetical protein U0L90_07935 [Flavobacteriaceae sp. LMIT009]